MDPEWPPHHPDGLHADLPLSANSNQLFQLAGAVTVWGAEVEKLCPMIFHHLLGAPPMQGVIFAHGQDFLWLHDRSVELLKVHKGEPWAPAMREAFKKAKLAMADRNRVVHVTWLPAAEAGIIEHVRGGTEAQTCSRPTSRSFAPTTSP